MAPRPVSAGDDEGVEQQTRAPAEAPPSFPGRANAEINDHETVCFDATKRKRMPGAPQHP